MFCVPRNKGHGFGKKKIIIIIIIREKKKRKGKVVKKKEKRFKISQNEFTSVVC